MGPTVNKSRSKKRAKKNTKNDGELSHCTRCGFTSKRAFNVIRHFARIHEPAKRKLRCCGKRFLTKGHYYQHCADVHPETRRPTAISSTRYKITRPVKNEMKNRRRSSRRVKAKKEDFHLDENTPLIYYVKNPEVVKKEEEIKFEDYHELELEDCCVRIIFKGDATSPVHSKIFHEFLGNIDFDRFKLVK